jgi:hypothetical protein
VVAHSPFAPNPIDAQCPAADRTRLKQVRIEKRLYREALFDKGISRAQHSNSPPACAAAAASQFPDQHRSTAIQQYQKHKAPEPADGRRPKQELSDEGREQSQRENRRIAIHKQCSSI